MLVVDDELEYAVRVAETLENVFRESHHNTDLRIELSNSAAFVAARIEACEHDDPPWDVILADVVMPRPARSPNEPIDPTATRCERSTEKGSWPSWEYRYTYNSRTPDIEHGGLYLAESIANRLSAGQLPGQLKLVLISRHLLGMERQELHELRTRHRDWLDYYDKAPWEDSDTWESALPRGVFQWALTQAIRDRKRTSWGDSVLDLVPEGDYFAHTSNQIDAVLVEARVRAEDDSCGAILVTGELGVGRRALSSLVHAIRNVSNPDAPLSSLDAWATPADRALADLFGNAADPRSPHGVADAATGGTLLIHELGKIPPYVQGGLLGLLDDGHYRRSTGTKRVAFRGTCVVLTAEDDLDRQVDVGVLDPRLRDRLAAGRIRIPPLRERPDDIVPLARQALKSANAAKIFTPEAIAWLQHGDYTGNTRELFHLVRGAALTSPASELAIEHLESVSSGQRHAPVSGSASITGSANLDAPNLLVRESPDIWRFRFRGGTVVHVRDGKGVATVAQLLEAPKRWIAVTSLLALEPLRRGPTRVPSGESLREAGVSYEGHSGRLPSTGAEARRLFDQLVYLEDTLEDARRNSDVGTATKATAALALLRDEIQGFGLSGAMTLERKAAKNRGDCVWKRIRRTCNRLEDSCRGGGQHIFRAIDSHQGKFTYAPAQETTWFVKG